MVSRKSRSCEISNKVPGYLHNQSCSQITASKSKWLVGSSNSNTSERHIKACAKLRRIRQPPENELTALCSWSAVKPKPFISREALA